MSSHLEELVAAVTVLAGAKLVDASRIVGLGNSEGTLHVHHHATTEQRVPFVGVILAAPPGRPVGDVLLSQLAVKSAQIPRGDSMMTLARAAAARYAQKEPMDADPTLPENVRMVLASFEAPANLPLARELWSEDATDSLRELAIPCLILIGGNDIQIDTPADGDPLRTAAVGDDTITFSFPPNANHVLKQDLRSAEERAAAPGSGYNEDGTELDPEAVEIILDWPREQGIPSRS
jgi:pimeloyl-ACP methyl ester carboxylesterase